MVTFKENGINITLDSTAKLAAAADYLSKVDLGSVGSTVAFKAGSDVYVYSQGGDNAGEHPTLVKLTDMANVVNGVEASSGATHIDYIHIA